MAATNEVVAAAEKWVNLALFASVTLLCLLTFRSWRVTLCIIIPLAIVTVLCNAVMAMLDIGVKVNTLPVVALGVGVGVDYGIYLFERMKHESQDMGLRLKDAFEQALKQRGTASVFTAVTMTISVATWMFSDLKFQGDMGILLAFMFLVNMFGAVLLLPALAAYLVGDRLRAAEPHGVRVGRRRRRRTWARFPEPEGRAQELQRPLPAIAASSSAMKERSPLLTSSPPMPSTSPSRAVRATRGRKRDDEIAVALNVVVTAAFLERQDGVLEHGERLGLQALDVALRVREPVVPARATGPAHP